MSLLLGTSGGLLVLNTAATTRTYDPVRAPVPDITPYYDVIGDLYKRVGGREVLEQAWQGLLAHLSGELLLHWQYAAARHLLTVPVLVQRKWVRFRLGVDIDLHQDPGGLRSGSAFTYAAGELACTWRNHGGQDRYEFALGGPVSDRVLLSWDVEVTFDSLPVPAAGKRSYALFGYRGDSAGVFVGLGADLQLVALHTSAGSSVYRESTPDAFGVGPRYRVSGRYRDGVLLATLYELDHTLVEHTGAEGVEVLDDADGDVYSASVRDTSEDFEALGVVAGRSRFQALGLDDVVLWEVVITAVVGDTLTLAEARLLPGRLQPYAIVDEVLACGVTLDVVGEATTPTFAVHRFGVYSLDLQASLPRVSTWTAAGHVPGNPISGVVQALGYTDPSVDTRIRDIPFLQPAPLDDTGLLSAPDDFSLGAGELRIVAEHPDVLFAEYVRVDEGLIEANFGSLVGLSGESSAAYLAAVQALFLAFFGGATPANIRRGVHVFMGLPIAVEAGVVTAVNASYSGTQGEITIVGSRTTTYLYPLAVGTSLAVDDVVVQFQVLCGGVEYQDYLTSPLWWQPHGMHELEKFHTFEVVVDAEVLDPSEVDAAVAFLRSERLLPAWKRALLRVKSTLSDSFPMSDAVSLHGVMTLVDPFFPHEVPRWDSVVHSGGLTLEVAGYEPLWRGEPVTWDTLGGGTPLNFGWERIRAFASGGWSSSWSLADGDEGRLSPGVLHDTSGATPETVVFLIYDTALGVYTQWEANAGVITCSSHAKYADTVLFSASIDYVSGRVTFTLNPHDLTEVWARYATGYVEVADSLNTRGVPLVDWWWDQTPDAETNPPPLSRAYIDPATAAGDLDDVDEAYPGGGWTWPLPVDAEVPVYPPDYAGSVWEPAADRPGVGTSGDAADPGQPGSAWLLIEGSPEEETTGVPPDAFWDGYSELAWDEVIWVEASNITGAPVDIMWFGVLTSVPNGDSVDATVPETWGSYP